MHRIGANNRPLVRAPVLLDLGAVALVGDATAPARARRLGLAARLVAMERGAQDERELGLRVVAVLQLIAGERRGDDQRAVRRELAREASEQERAIVVGERARGARVPAQLDLARDLVDVLTARTTG